MCPTGPKRQEGYRRSSGQRDGFTLVELVVTLLVVGVLAVGVLPRFVNLSLFDSASYADQLAALLRYGQKVAIAQRRMVVIDWSDAAAPLFQAYAQSEPRTCTSGGTPIPVPGGSFHAATTAVTLTSSSGTRLCFDALGKPYLPGGALATTLRIEVRDADATLRRSIDIEAETGYVH